MIKSATGAMFAILAAIPLAPSLARTFDHPTYSSTIALSADNKLVWSVNTADNSVSVISTASNSVIKKIAVGKEPQSIALDPDNRYAYVANVAGSTVTVIKIEESEPPELEAAAHGVLTTGSGNAIPGQPLIGAVEKATRVVAAGVLQAKPQDALGFDFNQDGHGNGFSPPSLLSIFAFPPYYHNGACETLACVLADRNHRTAGNKADVLADRRQQAQVVRFLESLDANTKPF